VENIDDFKISAGGDKSELIISSIYIGSTESANQKVCTLVIGKRNITINKDGIVDLDIGRSFILKQLLSLPLLQLMFLRQKMQIK
jgi:hypothetical protein